MKKLKYLLLIMVSTFVSVSSVNADSIPGWANYTDLTANGQVYLYNCTSFNCSSGSSLNSTHYYKTSLNTGNMLDVVTFDSMTYGVNGGYLAFTTDPYSNQVLYRLSVYFCGNNTNFSDNLLNYDLYAMGNSKDLTRSNGHLVSNYYVGTSMNTQPFTDMNDFAYCASRSYIFQTDINGRYFGISITRKGSTNYAGAITYLGYTLDSLGYVNNLSTSDIKNVVTNSGLATADSIDEVETAINEVKQELNNVSDSVDNLNDNITSTDTSEGSNTANSFFEGFTTDDYGLSDIVTMPLDLIKSLTNSTCVKLNLTLPFVNKSFDLPCMSEIYQTYFGNFFNLYQVITFGFISYWVIVRIFNLVKDFKNPDHDEIEVLDL